MKLKICSIVLPSNTLGLVCLGSVTFDIMDNRTKTSHGKILNNVNNLLKYFILIWFKLSEICLKFRLKKTKWQCCGATKLCSHVVYLHYLCTRPAQRCSDPGRSMPRHGFLVWTLAWPAHWCWDQGGPALWYCICVMNFGPMPSH